MNKTEIALAASAVTIVVLGTKLRIRNRQLKNLRNATTKLVEWSEIAQRVIVETWEQYPMAAGTLSEALNTDIQFYNIVIKENLT